MLKLNSIMLSVFCNTEDKNNDLDFVKDLFDEFFKDDFVVLTIQLNNIEINKNETGETLFSTIDRPQLKNSKSNEVINIMPDRIDYILESQIGDGEIDISENNKRIEYLERIMRISNKKASRISLNTKYLEDDVPVVNKQFNSEFYKEKSIVESNSRVVAIEKHGDEFINVINQINRIKNLTDIIPGNNEKLFEGTLIHNDINTHQLNANDRFTFADIREYFEIFFEINRNIIGGVN